MFIFLIVYNPVNSSFLMQHIGRMQMHRTPCRETDADKYHRSLKHYRSHKAEHNPRRNLQRQRRMRKHIQPHHVKQHNHCQYYRSQQQRHSFTYQLTENRFARSSHRHPQSDLSMSLLRAEPERSYNAQQHIE